MNELRKRGPEGPFEDHWTVKHYLAAIGLWLLVVVVLFLAGCASTPVPATTYVPVAIQCKPDLGPDPAYADSDAAIAAETDPEKIVKLLLEGREQRIQRDHEKTAALKVCQG
jgi:hypothetical protein